MVTVKYIREGGGIRDKQSALGQLVGNAVSTKLKRGNPRIKMHLGDTHTRVWVIHTRQIIETLINVREEKFMSDRERLDAYWSANIRLISITMAVWALVSYVLGIILAPALSGIYLGQLPLGFWFAHQGSMFVFVILIFVYSKLMDNLDKEYDVHEE